MRKKPDTKCSSSTVPPITLTVVWEADVIVLATPVYYFYFTSQLKKVTDRFYAINGKLLNKTSVLLASMVNPSERVAYVMGLLIT